MRSLGALALVLLLAGCAPAAPEQTAAPSTGTKPTATVTPTATPSAVQPDDVDPADFLLEGTPGIFDADGFWKGHYGFYTDVSKAVRCDVWIFSGDSGGVTCGVTPGNEQLLTVPVPDCEGAFSVGINFKVFDGNAGVTGCGAVDDGFAATTKVLLDHQTLVVEHGTEQFTCTVSSGVASCVDAGSGASITFGLDQTGFVS